MNRKRLIAIFSILLVVLAVAMLSASPALAKKGGRIQTAPTLVITPSPIVKVSYPFLVEGFGFKRTTSVFLVALGPNTISKLVGTDRNGNFSTGWSIDVSGLYTIEACQYQKKGWKCHLGAQYLTVE